MSVNAKRGMRHLPRPAPGFSLIEVLIALLVTALGLLGFAFLQTMNLRYTQSANYRTQATNLAYDLLDQIRANRVLLSQYVSGINPGSFAGVTTAGCKDLVSSGTYLQPTESMARWRCQVRAALGDNATAEVVSPATGRVQVWVNWADMRGSQVGDDAGTRNCAKAASSVCVETQL